MVSETGRRAIVAAGALAAIACGAVIARADDPSARTAQASNGGLSVAPVMIDRAMVVGAANAVTLSNNSKNQLTVTVKARPWKQSSSGAASPNRAGTLAGVDVSEGAFTLAPGAKKVVNVTLRSAPSGGALYGALEVIGVPSNAAERKGVTLGYRLLGTLRYRPATSVYKLTAGSPKLTGKGATRALTIAVRNGGNTIDAVTGSVRLKGPLGTRNLTLKATRILPGKSITLALASAKTLPAATYTATVTLTQNKKNTTITKKIKVSR